MEKIKIDCLGKEYSIDKLTTPLEFIKENGIHTQMPVAVVINGHMTRLDKNIRVNSTMEIIEKDTPQGERIYESSVLFLFLAAFTKTFPNHRVFIQHSIHRGVYAEIDGEIGKKDVEKVFLAMKQMVMDQMPITRVHRDWDVHLEVMEEKGRQDLISLFRYYNPTVLKFYQLDDIEESVYLPLLPNTKYLTHFELERYQDGIVILFPDFTDGIKESVYLEQPKMFETYRDYHRWSRILKIRSVGKLNQHIMNNDIDQLIMIAEANHEKKVAQIADQIIKSGETVPRLVLIAGPSCSGKTTFSKRLSIQLHVNGYRSVAVSLDDYFIDRDKTPKDKDGNRDFESLEIIDVELFNEHLQRMLKGEEVTTPHYDFHTGKRTGKGKTIKLADDQIIIIEGIHGLNPKLTGSIDKKDKFKVYVSALTQLNLHRHDRIPTSDTRLIRRLVRDSSFRGYSAQETLNQWKSVRAGEAKNIFPLQENADVFFNSALFYELSVLKSQAEKELLRVDRSNPMYAEAERLRKFLSYFLPIGVENVPHISILREFIGDSLFKY